VYDKNIQSINGSLATVLGNQPTPKMCKVKQIFDDFQVPDIEAEIIRKLQRRGTLDLIKPGWSIAITAGSRGVANYERIIKTIVDEVKRVGGNPFIIPAMGSHGGGTAEGQKEVLTSYNITEKTMGCPIRSTMETVQVGVSEYGMPVYIDKYASEADGIIVVNRVKPHTSFRGKYESGLLKMITIGLGKERGAETCHSEGFKNMEKNIEAISREVLRKCRILFGIAMVENAYDETRRIEVIPSDKFFEEEPILLEEAKKQMASILINNIDVLIVDEIGKNISGDGMDPNITGRFSSPYLSGEMNAQMVVVLDLTKESHGNASGLGMADFSTNRVFGKLDFEQTYINAFISKDIGSVKLPVIQPNDGLAIQAAINSCNCVNYNNPKIIRIKNTAKISEIYISEALLEEARANAQIEVLTEPEEMRFDKDRNLF
jgi:hypothetical protein